MSTRALLSDDMLAAVSRGLGLPSLHRVIVWGGMRDEDSPWDVIPFEPDAVVIRVWLPELQRILLSALGLNASKLLFVALDLEDGTIVRLHTRGFAEDVNDGLWDALSKIAGAPGTSTTLPEGRLSELGVRAAIRAAEERGSEVTVPKPYADLEEE